MQLSNDLVANVMGKACLVNFIVDYSQFVKIPRRNSTHAFKQEKDAPEAAYLVFAPVIICELGIKDVSLTVPQIPEQNATLLLNTGIDATEFSLAVAASIQDIDIETMDRTGEDHPQNGEHPQTRGQGLCSKLKSSAVVSFISSKPLHLKPSEEEDGF